jgi:hypothetical protein
LLTAAQLSLAKPNMAFAQEMKQQEAAQTTDKKVEQEKPRLIVPGYNALENAVVYNSAGKFSLRNRLLTNAELNAGPLGIGVSGLNEIVNLDPKAFYGDNTLYVRLNGSKLALAFQTKADRTGIFSKKYGARYIDQLLGGDLWVDAGIDSKAANITASFVRLFGNGYVLEIYSDNDFAKGQKPVFYLELQLDKEIGKWLLAYVRIEEKNLKDVTFMAGAIVDIAKLIGFGK